MSRTPHFSIMVPTYNQAGYLVAALNSLIAQNDPDWEAVVVDDGSTDDTPQVLEACQFKDPRIRAIRQENGGTAAALNTALANCRGTWIGWLSSDDLFEPDKLAIHRRAMAEHPDIHFFHTHFYHLEEDTGMKTAPEHWRPIPEPGLQVARFFSGNYVSGITICVERQAMLAAAPFRADLRHAQDFGLWLALSQAHRSHFIDRRTAIMRWHASQTTNAFPVAGLYDSAWALIDFLNANRFEALFPALDLTDPAQARSAVDETLAICLSPASFLYQLGYTPAMMERLLEWMQAPEGGAAREQARAQIREAVGTRAFEDAPAQVKAIFRRVLVHEGAFEYAAHSVVDFIRRTIASPVTDARKRRNLVRYLDKKKGEWKSL